MKVIELTGAHRNNKVRVNLDTVIMAEALYDGKTRLFFSDRRTQGRSLVVNEPIDSVLPLEMQS